MALAIRELELILIARDNASAVIARVGGAMVILGGIVTATGIKGVKELGKMTQEAIEFRQQIALAVTQADGLGANIENVAGIVNRVGSDIPVPFQELNEAIFDIFSTFTSDQLSSLSQAEGILRLFAESATAGQAPVRDIARSTIAWINALDQPATIENVTRLLDIQFELVRKGAGEYSEFAGEVGKAIPAFSAANQSVESFAGIMAFLTKNGLNAAMAATSAARAAELMFTPKAIKGLRKVGVAVEDGNGKFRAMEDIIRDLLPVMGGLSDAAFKIKFKEIFGTGRIQARRFFDLAIPNFEELEFLIGEMENSGGNVAEAFAFMFSQPQSQMELFRNKLEAIRRSFGDTFIDTLTTKVFPVLNRLFAWWEKLDPEMKKQIARWTSYATVIAVVGGVLLMVLGVGLLFVALLKAFGSGSAAAGIGKLVVSLGWVGVILAVIAGIAYLVWKNWDKVWPYLVGVWEKVTSAARDFMERNKEFFEAVRVKARVIWEKILKLGTAIWTRAKIIWSRIWEALLVFWAEWGDEILATFNRIWGFLKQAWLTAMDTIIGILDFFTALFEGNWSAVWIAVQDIALAAWDTIVTLFDAWLEWLKLLWEIAWDKIKQVASDVWEVIFNMLKSVWERIKSNISKAWNDIVDLFKGIWQRITGTAKDTVEGKGGLLEFVQQLPGKIIGALFSLASLLIEWSGKAWGALLAATGEFIGTTLLPFLAKLPGRILTALRELPGLLWNTGKAVIRGLWEGSKWSWSNIIVPYYTNILPKILKFFWNAVKWLFNIGLDILKGLLNGSKWYFKNLVIPWLSGIADAVKKGTGNLLNSLWQAGRDVITGFLKGMKSIWGSVTSWIGDKFGGIKRTVKGVLGISSPSKVMMMLGQNTMKGYQLGLRDQMKPINLMMSRFADTQMPRYFNNIQPSGSTTNNNNNSRVLQFGDIISQADPDEIAQAIAWELRTV